MNWSGEEGLKSFMDDDKILSTFEGLFIVIYYTNACFFVKLKLILCLYY